ncbi:MAG: 1-(5-phosphoribosyl)-5-[(5-phosphoribosylamino)methylideneamino]imidazole-4-carboxamide isomerase [Myxococcota bacterium]
MELIPAIDLLEGKVVRLRQGRYEEPTVYDDDPVGVAARFAEAGARRLHVVDLDGARDGAPGNVEVIAAILARVPVAVQVGGGIRDAEVAARWLDAGAERVVLGTAAIKNPALVRSLAETRAGSVVVAVDARGGEVAVEGWTEGSGVAAEALAREVDGWGAAAILYTNIERDGMRGGPDVPGTAALQAQVEATVIASGGIGSLAHLVALREAGVRAAVCGRALYGGAFTLPEAFAASAGEGPAC